MKTLGKDGGSPPALDSPSSCGHAPPHHVQSEDTPGRLSRARKPVSPLPAGASPSLPRDLKLAADWTQAGPPPTSESRIGFSMGGLTPLDHGGGGGGHDPGVPATGRAGCPGRG